MCGDLGGLCWLSGLHSDMSLGGAGNQRPRPASMSHHSYNILKLNFCSLKCEENTDLHSVLGYLDRDLAYSHPTVTEKFRWLNYLIGNHGKDLIDMSSAVSFTLWSCSDLVAACSIRYLHWLMWVLQQATAQGSSLKLKLMNYTHLLAINVAQFLYLQT